MSAQDGNPEFREISPDQLDAYIAEQGDYLGRLGESDGNARSRIFNGWWTATGASPESRPHYNVIIPDIDDLARARQLQPDCISAGYFLGDLAVMSEQE